MANPPKKLEDVIDMFDPSEGFMEPYKNTCAVQVGDPSKGWRLAMFRVAVLEASSRTPISYHNGIMTRMTAFYMPHRGFFLLANATTRQYWTRVYAVAELETHPFLVSVLCHNNTRTSLTVHISLRDDNFIEFSIFLPTKMVLVDVDKVLSPNGHLYAHGHQLTGILRALNLVHDGNSFCLAHKHVAETGHCLSESLLPSARQSAHLFQKFFDSIREDRPEIKEYALRTESLTSRLRPYQRDAVRFMIHRELNPQLRFHYSWFFHHIKMETQSTPIYYLPNLALFLTTPPASVPVLSTCGGILADEMGLGKTVELLALITSLTPDHTPEIVERAGGETQESDDVKAVLDDIVSIVVAAIEGEKAVAHFKRKKKNTLDMRFYSGSTRVPLSPSKKEMVRCGECGTACIQHRVHWSPGLSLQTQFVCPECIFQMKDPIPIKTTLIVLPNAIAHQWYEEIRKHVREDVKIDVYKGVNEDGYKHPHYLNQFDIVITTYDVVTMERNHLQTFDHGRLRKRGYEVSKSACTPLFSVRWWRVCLDESQMVDRRTSCISKLCKDLQARARWSVTGTPISDSIRDIHGLINFLGISPLDNEDIFDRLLYLPYINETNTGLLVHFMSRVMWRSDKNSLQGSLGRVTSHLESVTLSPMEERMYTDLLIKSKKDVLNVVGRMERDTRLSSLNRVIYGSLLTALSTVQLFLLTSLTSIFQMRRREDERDAAMCEWNAKTFTPESLFRRLLREKKGAVMRSHRDLIMYMNGKAALSRFTDNPEMAMETYSKVLQAILSLGPLNVLVGHSETPVFTSYEGDEIRRRRKREEKEEEKEGEAKDGRIGKAVPSDSLQFVHLYRNVQWLLNDCPELTEKNEMDLKMMTPIFRQAWETYSGMENGECIEMEVEWNAMKNALLLTTHDTSDLMLWIDELVKASKELVILQMKSSEKTPDWNKFLLMVEGKVGICFSDMKVVSGWMKEQVRHVSRVISQLVVMMEKCMEMRKCDDLAETVSEGTFRMSDLPKIINKNDRNDASRVLGQLGERHRGLKKDVIDIENVTKEKTGPLEKKKSIVEKEVRELFEYCVLCNKDGEFDAESEKSCLLCATEAISQLLQLKGGESDRPSRSRVWVLDTLEKALSQAVNRRGLIVDHTRSRKRWTDVMAAFNSIETFWKKYLIAILEKMNRVRELRQCTVRAEFSSSLEEEDRIIAKSKSTLDKAVANLKYVYSLREESMNECVPSTSASFSPPESSRECPICLDSIGHSWFVFPCAHTNCGDCFNRMVKLNGSSSSHLHCSVCRGFFARASVMFVSSKKKDILSPIGSLNLSVKLDKIVRLVSSILSASSDEKILVFTSHTIGMQVLRNVFLRADLPFESLHTDVVQSSAVLTKIRNDPRTRILLMRYESGGKGLNLTAANHIIFADAVEDPALEKQAIGRCDRIGQKRDVHVYYVIAQHTMEERMYHLTRGIQSPFYRYEDEWTVGNLVDLFEDA